MNEAGKMIYSSKLKDARQIAANYTYYYYKVIKKDINLYVKSLLDAWSIANNNLELNLFNEQLRELVDFQLKGNIYKRVQYSKKE